LRKALEMSRAFVREGDQDNVPFNPERRLSTHPNFVTPTGLLKIETRIRELENARQQARQAADLATQAQLAQELRYWQQRQQTARVVAPAVNPAVVRFGVQVTLIDADGVSHAFRLVGEDEADPAQGLLSWVSPLAQVLLGCQVGESVPFQSRTAQIVAIA
jgi:transcription elongation GreA/GreB family factor